MKKCLPTTNSSNHRNILGGGGGGILFHGLEYLIRREVLFYILSQLTTFYNIYFCIFTAVKIKLKSQFNPDLNQIWFPHVSPISVQFRTFPYRDAFPLISVHFHKILPFCWNVRKFSGNVWKFRSNSFREFHRILRKRFPYSSAEFYGNFLAGLKLDDIWRSHIDRTHIINFTS